MALEQYIGRKRVEKALDQKALQGNYPEHSCTKGAVSKTCVCSQLNGSSFLPCAFSAHSVGGNLLSP